MSWPLWTSLVVAMHYDIENTSVGTDHVIALPDLGGSSQRFFFDNF